MAVLVVVVAASYWWLVRKTDYFVLKNEPTILKKIDKEPPKKVIAVGDISCEPTITADASNCRAKEVVEAIEKRKPDNVLLLGDLQYDKGQTEYFKTVFTPLWQSLKPVSYAAPGNHEYYTKDAQGYFDYWNGDTQTSNQAGARGKGYYSFNIGKWHIISLNSNCEYVGGCEKGSAQANWLDRDLQNNKALCTLAFWHHPVFTSGKYRDNTESRGRGEYFWQLLMAHNAEVVLNGHDHIYERFEPQTSTGVLDQKGVREFVVGTGGKSQYSFAKSGFIANHAFGYDDRLGFLELTFDNFSYSWQFIDISGSVSDSGSAHCHR